MSTAAIVAIVVIIALAIIVAVLVMQRRRSDKLQERFGSEYRQTVAETGSRREAESELRSREKRRADLEIRALEPEARRRYADRWSDVQAGFVDDPAAAVGAADRLVLEVLRERGYPMDDFDQRAADISVDHPEVVSNYRAGHEISERNDAGSAGTEDLRQAMVHYRALFVELLEDEAAHVGR